MYIYTYTKQTIYTETHISMTKQVNSFLIYLIEFMILFGLRKMISGTYYYGLNFMNMVSCCLNLFKKLAEYYISMNYSFGFKKL